MTFYPLVQEPLVGDVPPAPAPTTWEAFISSLEEATQYLIEITAYDTNSPAGTTVLMYSDRHWVGDPGDADKPNAFYEGRVSFPLAMERQAPIEPEQSRRITRQFGAIELLNGDGDMDDIIGSHFVDGRDVTILFGPYMGAYNEFGVVAKCLAVGWSPSDLVTRLELRDYGYSLDLPVQSNLYAGSGGAEGGSDLEGKPKPLAFGIVRNAAPVLIDATNLIYQIHDGVIDSVTDVYDQGAALTDSLIDVSGYANLVAQPVSAGNFATALDVGLFKLGSSPSGLITCDVTGDATPSYNASLDKIAVRILGDRAGLDYALINDGNFAGAGAIAGDIGLYLSQNDTPTTADVMNILAQSCMGWWGAGRDGRVSLFRLSNPADRNTILSLNEDTIINLEPETQPVPRWRQRVQYQVNWTVQPGEDLAASVSDARRQFLAEQYRAVSASDATIQTGHLNAKDPVALPTLIDSSTDAQAVADLGLTLYGTSRQIFRATVKRVGYLLDLNSYVNVTWSRLGLSAGKNFAVVGISDRADQDQIILRLWG